MFSVRGRAAKISDQLHQATAKSARSVLMEFRIRIEDVLTNRNGPHLYSPIPTYGVH